MTLSLVANGALLEMRAQAKLKAEGVTPSKLTVFFIEVELVTGHRSTYADVTSGVTFKLHDAERTLERWRNQIAALKNLA